MNMKELKLKSDNELKTLLAESRDNWREMRFKVAQRQLKNVRDIRVVKKTIAQILTLLKQRTNLNINTKNI
ncbi:50S ribosomal protein L29 [Candidatus Kuenenbacteria bacterium CG23_combo_of_CG06-09_8_20_14_all_36_9]|uniref:Large ribosomal subunit protein uL29 n=1 Tax=Candidatus Kuenenbacteria bacterium CG10_big_fil_rev_8_21_14_0_10_36_11 TaxID=1974618 RepID=A0A2M6W9Q0_9BACT|nr:MAG: 50S ribosomal protein L29 [Candidatus Kuenenbacteria bacterium CG23_combo_of_CG06-09_8_20_14_all_36_9]PIT89540.1 MAG: 50S ribosomal protein L29 [Candidatus Kuenenbacteria bacterium CG10_big_fil_rev_8_21_14_0_10_36_11]